MVFNKKEYNREYQRAHRAQNNATRKKWREAHPEEAKELNRKTVVAWQRKNREKYNAYQRAWRAKKKAKLDKKGKENEETEPTEDEVSLTVQRIKAHNILRNMIIKEEK